MFVLNIKLSRLIFPFNLNELLAFYIQSRKQRLKKKSEESGSPESVSPRWSRSHLLREGTCSQGTTVSPFPTVEHKRTSLICYFPGPSGKLILQL